MRDNKIEFPELKNSLSAKRDCFLTCTGRLDGAGSQAHAIMSTMIAAKFLGFKYVHTPMARIAHNEEDINRCYWFYIFNESIIW